MALSPGFFESIGREFPVDFASIDPSDLATYGRDWTGAFPPRASILCRPHTTDEVSRLMKLCAQYRVPVVPSGGRTGLACGALATSGELILSLERMRGMEPVDSLGRTVRVQAGALIESVRRHCAQAGLCWPIDLHSTGSQIGGDIATNAGGMRVVRYGLTRHWVLGLTVVLASGDVLVLDGALEKSNAGVDLRQLFIGSEGILGVITEATLKLTRPPGDVDVLLLAVPSFAAVLEVFERARNAPFTLMAFESFTDSCLAHVLRRHQLQPAFDVPSNHYALLEVTRGEDSIDVWLESLLQPGLVTAARVAQNSKQAEELLDLPNGHRHIAERCGFHPQAQRCAAALAPSRLLCRTRDFARQQLFRLGAVPLCPCRRRHSPGADHQTRSTGQADLPCALQCIRRGDVRSGPRPSGRPQRRARDRPAEESIAGPGPRRGRDQPDAGS